MWFGRSANGFRGWFAVEVEGVLRTGLVPGDFVLTVINDSDTANTVVAVAQSTQKPGVYFFDVPSSFLVTHGAGQYNVVLVTNTALGGASQPPVLDVYTEMLGVTLADLDSLATPITELHRLAGLDATRPLVVTATTRDAGAEIEQTIAEAPAGTVTVTRV